MFSVIFEVEPKRERFDEYLRLAKELKPILESMAGFVDNERFESRVRDGRILSHSTWRDEKSLVRWRTEGRHYAVQKLGRSRVFEDYHLRVGDVVFDSAPTGAAPVRELRFDETEIGHAKYVTLTELIPDANVISDLAPDQVLALVNLKPDAPGLSDQDVFASIYHPGKFAILASWRTRPDAEGSRPSVTPGVKHIRHRVIRIVRDYGMFDRREAPQFFPEARR